MQFTAEIPSLESTKHGICR